MGRGWADIDGVETGSSIPQQGTAGEAGGSSRGVLTAAEFARRFRECSRLLWCIAASVVNDRSVADDVVQDAAMIALGKLDQFDPSTSFPAWAGQVVRFTALNHARKTQRERRLLSEVRESGGVRETDTSSGPQRAAVSSYGQPIPGAEAFDDQVQEALADLEETARACLLMKTTLDMAYTDIARALGIPEGTAMSHVHRARKAMRERLLAKGYTGGPAR